MTASATIHDLQAAKAQNLPATAPINVQPRDTAVMPGFNSSGGWELAQRIGKAFASSDLVPQAYKGNLANCIVALEMANRMGASPLLVMQNLYIVHGNPGWSSKFLIACFNQCGRFSSIRYTWNKDKTSCSAWAIEKSNNERIEGPTVTMAMAQAEGWSTKSGSKWKTMPELMLMYRAAAFMIRTYAPEISMGMSTDDEIIDQVSDVSYTNISDLQELAAPTPAAVIDPADAPDVGADKSALVMTFAAVMDKIAKAKTLDALDEAASLIASVASADHQRELAEKYDSRRADLL